MTRNNNIITKLIKVLLITEKNTTEVKTTFKLL